MRTPKSFGVSTSPLPKMCSHMRFTATRAVRGLDGFAMASASSRRPLPCVNAFGEGPSRIERKWRVTAGPLLPGLPRRKITGCTGCALSKIAIARFGAPSCVASRRSNWSLSFVRVSKILRPNGPSASLSVKQEGAPSAITHRRTASRSGSSGLGCVATGAAGSSFFASVSFASVFVGVGGLVLSSCAFAA